MGGKLYRVGENLKHGLKVYPKDGPMLTNLLKDDDERICLRYAKFFCLVKDREGRDPESRMKEINQKLQNQESEAKKKRVEQEKLNK